MICPLSGQCYAGAEAAGRGPRAPTPPSGEDPPAAEPCGMPGFSGSWGPGMRKAVDRKHGFVLLCI